MSLAKYESEVKYMDLAPAEVYARYADLRNLASVKEKLDDPFVQEKLAEQAGADKVAQLKQYAQQMSFEQDAVLINSPMGNITLRIVERDEPKCLKFASEGSPVQLYLWIQLLPHEQTHTKMRVTVGAEVNMFMKGMVAKPLQQAADGLASMLAAVR